MFISVLSFIQSIEGEEEERRGREGEGGEHVMATVNDTNEVLFDGLATKGDCDPVKKELFIILKIFRILKERGK